MRKKMRFKMIVTTATAICLFMIISSNNSFSERIIKIAGSTVFKNTLIEPNKQTIEQKTGLKLDVVGNGSGRGLTDLVDGKADVAILSSQLEDVAAKINGKTPGKIDLSKLKTQLIGNTTVAIAVHPSNSVKNLKAANVIDLLSGKIKNWKEVGGADTPVIVTVGMPGDGTRTTLEKHFMNDVPIASDARQLASATQVATIISQLPGAIGPLGESNITKNVSILTTDVTVSAPLVLVTIGEPDADTQKLITVLTSLNKK